MVHSMQEEVRGQVSEVVLSLHLILRSSVAPVISEISTPAYLAWKLLANSPIVAFWKSNSMIILVPQHLYPNSFCRTGWPQT